MRTSRDSNDTPDRTPGQRRPSSRLLLLLLPLGFGIALVIAAVAGLVSGTGPDAALPSEQPAAAAGTKPTAVPPTQMPETQAEPTDQLVPTEVPAPDTGPDDISHVVAEVNGQILDQQMLQMMQAADRAMAALLDQPPPSGHDTSTMLSTGLLDRLVNGELVWQAAQAAGFALDQEQVDRQLRDFLAARDKSMAELESAVTARVLQSWRQPQGPRGAVHDRRC